MMPLKQTTIYRTPTTSNTKNNTQNEPETTNYTWQQVKNRKISNQTPETTTVGNSVLFHTQTNMTVALICILLNEYFFFQSVSLRLTPSMTSL
jgi:hypothetical protein